MRHPDTSHLGPAGRLGSFFIDSKLTPLLVLAALLLGVAAIELTPREEEPQIVVPIVDLYLGLPGATPEEVENRLVIPLEKRLWEIPGVEYVYSAARAHGAVVTARFHVGDDPERALVRVYEKVTSGLDRMPDGATPPLIKHRTIDDVPVYTLTLWASDVDGPSGDDYSGGNYRGSSYDGYQLRRLASELATELSKLPDVSDIRLHGGQTRTLRVQLDASRLAGFGLDPLQIASALRRQNAGGPAGRFESGNQEVLVETGAFLTDADELRRLVVGVHSGLQPIYLQDIATILDGPADATSYVEHVPVQGEGAASVPHPAVTLALAKRQGADAQHVVDQVNAKLEVLEAHLLPPGVELTVSRNYGATATEKADELLMHLTLAILAVTIVIGFALGWRGALVVLISVPISFALTLFVYYAFGYTLNRVTLFALVFVTGIVVDDSIIVVENIVRHLAQERGSDRKSRLRTAIEAVNEVGNPTILATLTVIGSVLPMAFVRGLMGPYMRPMPIGASLAMLFSLGVALIAAPWFGYRLLRATGHLQEEGHLQGEADEGAGIRNTRTYRLYRRILGPLLERPLLRWATLGVVGLLLLASLALFPLQLVTVKMLPFDNKSELQVLFDLPEGTTLETTARVTREAADYLRTVPEVTHLQLYTGTAAPINFNGLVRYYDLRQGSNLSDIQVNLVHKEHRDEQSHDIAKRLRPPLEAIAERHGARVKVVEVPPGPPVLSTLVAEVYGPDMDSRLALAEQVRELFEQTPGVVDVDWMVEDPQPRLRFGVDRQKAALHGISPAQIAGMLSLAFGALDAGSLHDPRETAAVPLRLELPRAQRAGLDQLRQLRIASPSTGALVPLADLVTVDDSPAPPSRYRKNLQPVVYVTADVAVEVESPVYAMLDLAKQVEELHAPDGSQVAQLYTAQPLSEEQPSLKWDGEWQITYEVFRDLGAAFGAVLVLIYLLLIGWFGSFRTPVVMMVAIPLSLVGILPGHWLFGAFFTATSMIGFIALAGIMVRNSVLLIDFVHLALDRGRGLHDALLEAGAVRLRPILLTAGTVVVGAFVILFDPIFQGLAISLMTGTLASTALTLVVVPLIYAMLEKSEVAREMPAPKIQSEPDPEEAGDEE